ncbi:MAG TPA: aminotransferase class I/II-fold pyridoxal phosphate-dependent enzyme [Devosiaceae bacterium]
MTPQTLEALRPFYAMEILAQAKALEQQGREICHLELGEPAAAPAPRVRDAVAAALGEPQRYTHAKGQVELREALSGYYRARHGAEIDPERLLVTMGSSAGFVVSFLAGFEPGATIALTRPGYPAYRNILVALGFNVVEIALSPANGWRLTAEQVMAAHRAQPFAGLLFASPANPTGASVGREALGEIVAACARLRVRLVSDEIYHGLTYAEPSVSAAEFTSDAIIVNSFSKYYCMTGWRVGWVVLPEALVRRAEILQQNLFISAPTLSQVAARAALQETGYSEEQRARYAANRGLLADGLDRLGFGVGTGVDGAFYTYVDASRFTNDSMRFCQALLETAGVAATPGVDFDRIDGHRYVRFSFAGSGESIAAAIERMAALDLGTVGR